MTPNLLIFALAALIPLIMGFIWYNPKVFGTVWMETSGITEEKIKGANMPLVFILCYIFSFMIASAVNSIVIHQGHIYSILLNEAGFSQTGSEVNNLIVSFMEKYGKNFRTFKHGAFHGILFGIFLVLPVIATNALFERKGFKYIAMNSGYWIVCLAIMGGIICEFG